MPRRWLRIFRRSAYDLGGAKIVEVVLYGFMGDRPC